MGLEKTVGCIRRRDVCKVGARHEGGRKKGEAYGESPVSQE